ncbi:Y-family DNA polymerase [Flavisolibacter ginsenosidimutans]|uniref:Y-family DNA polymerase n=1 Tax=Flavisolibacter ginsenosidimutans TaxID=661481 RepID=A0A5B8UMM8_9BACT|nr:Y-family DNA polymerase [Flavisolibacter ginsenosidimutans]QEC57828.1 Y-family DNA polymerase [Flavisolibacter ginsenosidimutans]
MYAIVDCNSFYCSCERVFQPKWDDRPVVVLSNNDGCIISRSDEAKDLGVEMAGPYFIAKPLIEKYNVGLFSSNYNLYGDMSMRVMDTLRHLAGDRNVEVYSVDESFVNLFFLPQNKLREFAMELRHTVERWTGVAVSVGVAPTKTLAKLANGIAKKYKRQTECVAVLETGEKIAKALRITPVGKLWGVGGRSQKKLNDLGIHTGWDLRNMPEEWARKNLGGVVGVRLIKELRGEEAIVMDTYEDKKMIATTRMFGNAVTALADIKEAVATYTARTAEKLRRQNSAAGMINVFVVTNEKENRKAVNPHFRHGPTYSSHIVLPYPTSQTNELIKPAIALAEKLYREGKQYKKAGVVLSGIVPDDAIQANMFEQQKSIGRFLMEQIDNINFSMRGDVVKFASSGTKRNWKMRQDFQTPRYTTRWNELCKVS